MSHMRGSSAVIASDMVRTDAVVRHQRTNTALVGRDYAPASQVSSSRLNIGRGNSATRRSNKNFGHMTQSNNQNLILNEQSFAQIGNDSEQRSRPQSGQIRPPSAFQSFTQQQSFNQSPVNKRGRIEAVALQSSPSNHMKNVSLSQYINQLQSDHITGKTQAKSRMSKLHPFSIGQNGSPVTRVHLNQSMTNDLIKQHSFVNSFQQSRLEKNESQISSCHPKFGKPVSVPDQDFGVSGKKIEIKTFIDTIPASFLPKEPSNLNGDSRTGVLVENRRRTIILKTAMDDREDTNMHLEEILSEEDRKNFSIVNIQALADPRAVAQSGQYEASNVFGAVDASSQFMQCVDPQQFYGRNERDSRLSIDSQNEIKSTGTMRVSAIISEQNSQPMQSNLFSPAAQITYSPKASGRQEIENEDQIRMSFPVIEENNESYDRPVSPTSSGWGPSYRGSKQIKQMEKLANLIEIQQKQIIKTTIPLVVLEQDLSQSKNQTCQVSEDKNEQADQLDATDSQDMQIMGNLDGNLCQVIQEEDEIEIINDNEIKADIWEKELSLQEARFNPPVNQRPRSSQQRNQHSLIDQNTLSQENDTKRLQPPLIEMDVRQYSKLNNQNIQCQVEDLQEQKHLSLAELQEITDLVYARRNMEDYNMHGENMSDMKGFGKNLLKKKKILKNKQAIESKKSIFDSFQGSYANYKIANSRSRPSKTNNYRTTAGSTRLSRDQFLNYGGSQDQRILVPGPNDASRVIFSNTQKIGKGNLMIRSSRGTRKSSMKKMKNLLNAQEAPNEIEEAIQARVQMKMQQYKQEMAQQNKQTKDIKATNRLSAALRVKNGGQLFHIEKQQIGRKQPKELGILANRARLNSANRFRSKADTSTKPIVDMDDAGLSLGDYATAYSSNQVWSRRATAPHNTQAVPVEEAQTKVAYNSHFQKIQTSIKDLPFRQKNVQSVYLQQKEVKPKDPECDGEFKSIDSIVKPSKTVPFDLAVHSRAPADKKNLRYSKFQDPQPEEEHFAEEIDNSKLFGNKNGFEKNKIQSNKIREIFKVQQSSVQRRRKHVPNEKTSIQKALEQMPTKPILTKQEKLDKLGNQEIDYHQPLVGAETKERLYAKFNECFDPMRLKIIMLQKGLANPFGKNPDYFFVKGLDYLNAREVELAIKCFEKGVHDKSTHLLCRFNLGYTLFKVGHFQAAVGHYETLVTQCFELNIHPHRFFPSVLYNKTVCELQSGQFLKAAATAKKCVDFIKEHEKNNGGNILSLTRKDQELLIDMCQLRGLALFRGGECKLGGQSLEAADVQLAIIEQHEADIALKKEQGKINRSQQSNRSSPSNSCQILKQNSKIDNDQINEEGAAQNTHRRHAGNMNLTIEGFQNLRAEIDSPGLGERAGSVAPAAGREPGIELESVYDGENRNQSELRLQSLASPGLQNQGQKQTNQAPKNDNVTLKLDTGRTKRSTARLSRNSRSNPSKLRKQASKKIKQPVAQDFEVLADQANEALDLDQLKMKNNMTRGIPNIKRIEDSKYRSIQSYLLDFRDRLEASIRAVASGNDEVRVFRDGDKEEGAKARDDADSDAEARNLKKTNRLTYRNTQRGKSKNQLEMEVEKDLTHLKNLLYKKREEKKKFNKETQIITLEDKAQLKSMMVDLAIHKKAYIRGQGFVGDSACLSLEYPKQTIVQILDHATKYREVRESFDEQKRQWLLERGIVDYMVLNRGDVLYEQDITHCDAQYMLVGGKVSLIKTFVDHELIYKMKQEARLEQSLAGQDPVSSLGSSLARSEGPALLDAILEVNEPNMAAEVSSSCESGESMASMELSSPERSLSSPERSIIENMPKFSPEPLDIINEIPSQQKQGTGKQQLFEEFLHDLSKVELAPRKPTDISEESQSQSTNRQPQCAPVIVTESDVQEDPLPEPQNVVQDLKTKMQALDQKQIDDISKNNRIVYDYETAAEIEKRGVVVHPVDLQRGEADVKISIVEYSHYQGQFFGNDAYLDWKALTFNQKMLSEVEVMIADKSAVSGYVRKYLQDKEEKEAAEFADFQKLSIVRQETIMKEKGLTGKSDRSSPARNSSPNLMTRKQSSKKVFDSVINKSPTKNDPQSPSIKAKISLTRKLSTNSLKMNSQQSEGSPQRLNLNASSDGLKLQRQETEDIEKQIKGYGGGGGAAVNNMRHRSTVLMNKVIGRMGALKDDAGSVDSMKDEGPWPLTQLKRENSCLVMEDNTLIIRIPYRLERMYVAHLAKLREEELDH